MVRHSGNGGIVAADSAPVTHDTDILILGSGAAGLCAALEADPRLRVTLLCKASPTESSTNYAQGGVSAVLDDKDSVALHVADTTSTGGGLCHPEVVQRVTDRGAAMIRWLQDQGVNFTPYPPSGGLHLTQEGGHSRRRVAHVADHTGRTIQEALMEQVRSRPNVALHSHCIAVDLIVQRQAGENRCIGIYAQDTRTNAVDTYRARCVILATGGASKVYLYTSNPDTSSGDGLAMAWRAGCRVANMEFIQFHPTCLYDPRAKSSLMTEALRGEGAKLRLPGSGEEFMPRFDERGELAPRDIIARAIDHEMKRLGLDYVHLDISHKPADELREAFPNAYSRCLEYDIDLTRQPIPVVPAAHYTCGGIMTDRHGCTDLPGLYAIGEVAHTGLHGANRMASNSLLECLVLAHAASGHINETLSRDASPPEVTPWDESRVSDSDEEVVVSHNWDELRRFMWDYVGIVRTSKRLERAQHRCTLLHEEINEYYRDFRISRDLIELRNLVQVADLIIRCAMMRRESRGLHYTLDYPELDPTMDGCDTVLHPEAGRDLPLQAAVTR